MNQIRTIVLSSVVALAASSMSNAAVLEYNFNDPSPLAAAGSLATGGRSVGLTSPAIVGAAGSGVSGLPSDRALSTVAAASMGGTTNGSGGRAAEMSDINDIDGLLQFTISGWFKTDGNTPLGSNAVLIYNRSGVTGFAVYGDPNIPGNLVLAVDNGANSSAGFGSTAQWVNFAVTYDGTILQPGPNVFFYMGDKYTSLSLVGSGTNTNGSGNDPAGNDTAALSFGARNLFGSLNGDSFDGYLDNLRITDSVLPLAQLEILRAYDVTPEPATVSMLILAGTALIRRRQSRLL